LSSLWTALERDNELLPPSQAAAALRDDPPLDLLERLTARLLPELPGPAPAPFFDAPSARAMARVVHAALARLHAPTPLVPAFEAVPDPRTPAAHLTQAALGLFALPVLQRFRSQAFQAAAAQRPGGEPLEAVSDALADLLGSRPLLALRPEAESALASIGPLRIDGVEDAPALRRWLVHRLAARGPDPAAARRRAAIVRALRTDAARREILLLLDASAPAELLAGFRPYLDRWPDTLAPDLRRRLETPPDGNAEDR